MDKESKQSRTPKDTKPPIRPSHERVVANAEKWANSTGLQPPK